MSQQEVEILKSLSFDRSIVQFYGTCPWQGKTMLVLEHMEVIFLFTAKSNKRVSDFFSISAQWVNSS